MTCDLVTGWRLFSLFSLPDEDTKITGNILERLIPQDPCISFTMCFTTFTFWLQWLLLWQVSLKVANFLFNEYLHIVPYRPLRMLMGDPPKIKSVRSIFMWQKTLMKVLMSFYEDREEEGEENIEVREEEEGLCLCLKV